MRRLITFLTCLNLSISLVWAEGYVGLDANNNRTVIYTPTPEKKGGLTDQEMDMTVNYNDQELHTKDFTKLCSEKPEQCDGKAGIVFGDVTDQLLTQALPKAYAMIVNLGGFNKFKVKVKPEASSTSKDTTKVDGVKSPPAENAKVEEKTEERTDYCALIAGIGEMVAQTTYTIKSQFKDPNVTADPSKVSQRASLEEAKSQVKVKEETAFMQAMTWSATSACYAGYGVVAYSDPGYWVKTGFSALITTYMWYYWAAQKEKINGIEALLEKFPNKLGDCNPATQTTCFCAQDHNRNKPEYAHYCMPSTLSSRETPYVFATSCVNSQLKDDPNCNCKNSNTCADITVSDLMVSQKLGSITTKSNPDFAKILGMARGQASKSSEVSPTQRLAAIKKRMNELASQIPEDKRSMTAQEEGAARDYVKAGLPPAFAKAMALHKHDNNPALAQFENRFRNMSSGSNSGNDSYSKYQKGAKFEGGYGLKSQSSNKDNTQRSYQMDFFKQNNNSKKSGPEVLQYADKASREAEINKDKSQNIFQTISNRYRTSGAKRLE